VNVDEPGADLAACFAIASSTTEVKLPPATVFIGEVGLAGEVRTVTHMQARLDESARLGFTQAVVPKLRGEHVRAPQGMKLIQLNDLREGLEKFYLVG
jgi:DNA repair protein RadA/Sms